MEFQESGIDYNHLIATTVTYLRTSLLLEFNSLNLWFGVHGYHEKLDTNLKLTVAKDCFLLVLAFGI